MAINIFQGSSKPSSKVNSASASTRAKTAREALATPAVASDTGNTAVGTSGTLSKVGNFVGKAAGIASKFLPGVGGMVAKGLANIFNDPEWWQSVPGDAVTLNTPLRMTEVGDFIPTDPESTMVKLHKIRPAVLEFTSCYDAQHDTTRTGPLRVITATPTMMTQYFMPQIRKVVNAITLQSADAYGEVLAANATLYALWRQLKKLDYLLKHGQTYLPNFDDPQFPVLRVASAAWLQSTIGRLEEYLRANVRLPHTLCEYLAWRYGRIYRSTNSAKAALVMHSIVSIRSDLSIYDQVITECMATIASTEAYQKANADIYNAYYDHDFMVEIRDDTQCMYDVKEFALRTNLNIGYTSESGNHQFVPYIDESKNAVYLDSAADNPTLFMASTVSTAGEDQSGQVSVLFPVRAARAYLGVDLLTQKGNVVTHGMLFGWPSKEAGTNNINYPPAALKPRLETISLQAGETTSWLSIELRPMVSTSYDGGGMFSADEANAVAALTMGSLCKALDLYNFGIYVPIVNFTMTSDQVGGPELTPDKLGNLRVDITSLSMDLALVPESVLGNEHVYAFANLMDTDRKTSLSYAKAEKLVAKDVANLVDKIDVAASASPS